MREEPEIVKQLRQEELDGLISASFKTNTTEQQPQNNFETKHQPERTHSKKLEDIFNAAADGIRIISNDFKVREMNRTMENLSGKSADQAIGMHCRNLFGSLNKCGTDECSMIRVMRTVRIV